MWFHPKDIRIKKTITVDGLLGYVLPHAGTAHSGKVLSHTLRFKPSKPFKKVLIVYYPAANTENVKTPDGNIYHEELVVKETMKYIMKHAWKIKHPIQFIGHNVRDNLHMPHYNPHDTLLVISADFSHHLPMKKAIELENCAANAVMQKHLVPDTPEFQACLKVLDHLDSFKMLYKVLPKSMLQWVGRGRSKGLKGVGYLSFLIREPPNPHKQAPDGIFVTAYDKGMKQRECLGEWYKHGEHWSKQKETALVNKVLRLARTTSRLTGGNRTHIPITHYTITYLYHDNKPFIRGYHGLLSSAFYLPSVFLENTHDDGTWIKPGDRYWKTGERFSLNETFRKLSSKSGKRHTRKIPKHTVYSSRVVHRKVKH